LIYNALATTDAMNEVFADASVIQSMLDVEVALARVQARLRIIPVPAADAIAAAATVDGFDAQALARESRVSGTVAVPLVAALAARVREWNPSAAGYVHFGATSQDIVDTSFVRLIVRAGAILNRDQDALSHALRELSERHAGDVMLGRTLLQPAPPITFGLKAAGWFAGAARTWAALERARRDACVLQFGGAAGTLAALGNRGLEVAEALAEELALPLPDAPWHAYSDRLAGFASAAGIYAGTLGKIAGDIALLMQPEIAEVAERGGGSSTMPHKKNPSGCAIAIAAAGRMPGLVSSALAGLAHEHERSAGPWHAQWTTIVDVVQTCGSSLAAMGDVIEGLTVDTARMRANIDATGGAVFAEREMLRLAPSLGRERAHEAAREWVKAGGAATVDPASYLGAAEHLRRRLLGT
jgi:3-carboxy-cis,cis-muconate cycloisomerase